MGQSAYLTPWLVLARRCDHQTTHCMASRSLLLLLGRVGLISAGTKIGVNPYIMSHEQSVF